MDELKPTRWDSPLAFRVVATVAFGRPSAEPEPSLASFLTAGDDGDWHLDLSGVSYSERTELFATFDEWRAGWVRTFSVGELDELSDLTAAASVAVPDTTLFDAGSLSTLWGHHTVTLHTAELARLSAALGEARDVFDEAAMKGVAFEPLGQGRPRSAWVCAGDEVLVRSASVSVIADDRARCWLDVTGSERVRLVGWERQGGQTVMFAAAGDDVVVVDPDALIVEWLSPRSQEVAIMARPLSQLWRHIFDGLTAGAAFALPRGVPLVLEPRP